MRMKYGFADSPTEYTLDSFARMANEFKRKYFDGRKPTISELEKEFWRLVTQPDDEEIDFKVHSHCDSLMLTAAMLRSSTVRISRLAVSGAGFRGATMCANSHQQLRRSMQIWPSIPGT